MMPSVQVFAVVDKLCPSEKRFDAGMEHGVTDACMQHETQKDDTSIRRRSGAACACCSLISVVFAAVLGVNLYVLLFLLKLDEKQLHILEKIESYEQKPIGCIPCRDVQLHPSEDRHNFRQLHVDKEKDECCAKNSRQLGILLDLSFERKYRIAKAMGTFDVPKLVYVNANDTKYLSNHKPSAHLMASYDQELMQQTKEQEVPLMIRKWNYNKDIAFVRDGLEYKNGRLIVHKEGTYYIYSNIAFLKYYMKEEEKESSSHSLMHIVARYNIIYPNGGEERLFEASKSQCWAKNKRYGEYVSHLGGVLKLNRGDEIYVKVRDLRSMVQRPKATYFGMYMI